MITVGRKSPYSLYREDYASFGEQDVYNQAHAESFIKLFGLPQKVQALLNIEGGMEGQHDEPDYSKFKRDWYSSLCGRIRCTLVLAKLAMSAMSAE